MISCGPAASLRTFSSPACETETVGPPAHWGVLRIKRGNHLEPGPVHYIEQGVSVC